MRLYHREGSGHQTNPSVKRVYPDVTNAEHVPKCTRLKRVPGVATPDVPVPPAGREIEITLTVRRSSYTGYNDINIWWKSIKVLQGVL